MKTEIKDLGMEPNPGEGVMHERFPHNRKPSHRCVSGELWNLRGHHNQKGGGVGKNTEYVPNHKYQEKWSRRLHALPPSGAGQGGRATL